ncbi:MAG: hypothetical protein RDV48_16225 [Candidatus Eremiobacteraeota bacterium]|nr:hypothetical protein [Candidatus Eremiobacteraeota bacterium]
MDSIGRISGQNVPLSQTQDQAPAAPQKEAAPKDSFKKAEKSTHDKVWKGIKGFSKTLFAGFGMGSGAVGGFTIGGAIAATGNIISGLFTHSLTMAAASSAGITGGVIGAVVFGACGMMGGYQFGDVAAGAAHKAYDFVADKLKS